MPSSSLEGRTVQRGEAGLGIRINWFFTWANKLDQSKVSGWLKPGGHAVSGGLWRAAFVLWSVFGINFPPMEAAKALGHFHGDAAQVPAEDRRTLAKAVTEWDYTLASIPRKDATLAP